MKKIEAVIKPFKLEEVQTSLARAGVTGLTISEVKGFGRQKGHSERYRGIEYIVDFLPKLKLEIIVEEADAGRITEVILKTARTGRIGDGKIFVHAVHEVVRVRTDERGADAL